MLKVAVVLFDGVEELDFAGPYEVFAQAADVFTVAASETVRGSHGLKVSADHTFATAPEADVLVVPGGPITRENPEALESVVEYVKHAAGGARIILSAGTGAFLLARAGLLDGRSCTTHYRRRHLLAAQFPSVRIRYARVVADGKVVTTAGVSAGIDGSLHVISRLFGMERARKLAKAIEYPWHSSHILNDGSMSEPYLFAEEMPQASGGGW